MNQTARRAPESLDRLPVLTEVVKTADAWARQESTLLQADPVADRVVRPGPAPGNGPDPDRLEEDVLSAVQQHIDLMFEYRLREAIAPALARAADQLIKDLKEPLAADLRDVAQRAVAQELARRRKR